MKKHHLPLYQYTAREVVSGLQFIAYGQECCLPYAVLFAEVIIDHLKKCGVDLRNCRFQTDNGSEFIGAWSAKEPSAFTKTVESVKGLVHDTIPPGAHTYQADVETVHGIIEDEFYEIESFPSLPILLAKATHYIIWFNIARRNSYKGYKTPWEIIHERDPTISPQIATLPALSLDHLWKIKCVCTHTSLPKQLKGGMMLFSIPLSICGIKSSLYECAVQKYKIEQLPLFFCSLL
jgi:hypothetical protein